MNPEQYRIGNYVHFLGEVKKIEGISIKLRPDCGYFWFENFEREFKGIHVTPIELTEEWLIKFGFKFKEYGFGESAWKQWNLDGFVLNGFRHSLTGLDLKYVHQLQNLYFALTGEELTIKK